MEMPTSTCPSKRVCTTDPEEEHQDIEDLQLVKIAIGTIETGLALLPKTYKNTLLCISTKYIKVCMEALYQKLRVQNLKDNSEYIPKSARFEFELQPKKNIKDLKELKDIAKKFKQQKKNTLLNLRPI